MNDQEAYNSNSANEVLLLFVDDHEQSNKSMDRGVALSSGGSFEH